MDKSAIVEVYAAVDGVEAYALKGLLEAAGIPAEVVGDNLAAAAGGLPLGYATAPRIWVRQADERRAREIIDQWENQQDSATALPSTDWHCSNCGEVVPGATDVCWSCGTDREGRLDPNFESAAQPDSLPIAEPLVSPMLPNWRVRLIAISLLLLMAPLAIWLLFWPKTPADFLLRGDARYMKGDWQRAMADYGRAIQVDPQDADSYHALARLLATCPDPRFRNGTEAVKNARQACALTHWQGWYCLDVLAAAYAEVGDFENAVYWAKETVKLSPADEIAESYRRLELYKAHKPYRLDASSTE